MMTRVIKDLTAYGFSIDKRKRRKQHRRTAKDLLTKGGIFDNHPACRNTFHSIAMWHLSNARYLGR